MSDRSDDKLDRTASFLTRTGRTLTALITLPVVGLFFFGLWGLIIGLVVGLLWVGAARGGQVGSPSNVPQPMQSDTRACPFCAEEVKKAAIVCKHCGRDIPEWEDEEEEEVEPPNIAEDPGAHVLSADPMVREQALHQIGQRAMKRDLEPLEAASLLQLIQPLRDDPYPAVRARAKWASGYLRKITKD